MSKLFWEQLSPRRLTEVVDIGANPIDGDPPYKSMLAAGLCRVTGFEPQEPAFSELQKMKSSNEHYLPYAIGDGKTHTLNIYPSSGLASLLELDSSKTELFEIRKPLCELVRQIPMSTRKLDDIAEIHDLDFLKIDVQGSELAVFRGGTGKLAQAVAIQAEVSFVTLYKNQPSIGDIDLELREQGFIPHCIAAIGGTPIAPYPADRDPHRSFRQLVEADIVYVRDFSHPESMSDEQLKHLALVAHHCYGSADLALRCVMLLERRKVLRAGAQNRYLEENLAP